MAKTMEIDPDLQAIFKLFDAGRRGSYIAPNYVNDGLRYHFSADEEHRLKVLAAKVYPQAEARPASWLDKLVAKFSRPPERPYEGKEPILYAARTLNVPAVEILRDAKANLDAQDNNGVTASMSAIFAGAVNGTQYAIEGDINTAIANTINALIDGGADLNIQDANGETVLMHTAYSGYGYKRAVENAMMAILESGKADLHIRNKDGKTALDIAEQGGNLIAADHLRKAIAAEAKAHASGTPAPAAA